MDEAATAASDPTGPGLHVVLGNESCDLDSMVSALVYAYFLSKTSHRDVPAVPLLNITSSELVLRSDSILLLRKTAMQPEQLLFRNQLDLRALQQAGRLRLTLVDHNVLPSSDSDLEGAVVDVIDHHHLDRLPSPTCTVTVETVGSCATLITERIIHEAPQILDLQLAHLLYAAVVVDCVDMSPAAGKVTPKDCQFVAELERRFPALPPRGPLFQELHKAKFDVSGLDIEQMLMKDMKTVSGSLNVAVSVLYMPLKEFMMQKNAQEELSSFCHKFGFDLLLLMTICFTDSKEPIRELAIFSHNPTCRDQVSRYLEQSQSPALNLRSHGAVHPYILAYHQGNSVASRKKVLPIVRDFLRTWDGGPADVDVEEAPVPPTPMNSLVEGSPLDGGLPPISSQDLERRISQMGFRTDL
ncbi:exopolyphosphatase PRUNE1 isoform 2-T2 [Pholidichthys leucotaenia]